MGVFPDLLVAIQLHNCVVNLEIVKTLPIQTRTFWGQDFRTKICVLKSPSPSQTASRPKVELKTSSTMAFLHWPCHCASALWRHGHKAPNVKTGIMWRAPIGAKDISIVTVSHHHHWNCKNIPSVLEFGTDKYLNMPACINSRFCFTPQIVIPNKQLSDKICWSFVSKTKFVMFFIVVCWRHVVGQKGVVG